MFFSNDGTEALVSKSIEFLSSSYLARNVQGNEREETYISIEKNSTDNITRNVGQDGGYNKKLRNKMASVNARISIGI
jgi:hypothetical protein